MAGTLNLYRPGQRWRGISFDCTFASGQRSELRPETSSQRRFRLVQGDVPLLWARIFDDWYGVELRTGSPVRPVIAPIRSDKARAIRPDETVAWWSRWAFQMAAWLHASQTGPLHRGRWMLRPIGPGRGFQGAPLMDLECDDFERAAPLADDSDLFWGVGGHDAASIIPLRPWSQPDAARVKAWRKHVLDKTLPPVLAWWVGGLCSWVVLDGHDRFVAAQLENRFPPMLGLSEIMTVTDARSRSEWTDLDDEARLERVRSVQPDHWQAHEMLAQVLVRSTVLYEEMSRTTAWPTTAAAEEWPI